MHDDTTTDEALVGPVARAYIRAIQARQPPPTSAHHGSTWRSRWSSQVLSQSPRSPLRTAGDRLDRIFASPPESTISRTPRRGSGDSDWSASPVTPPAAASVPRFIWQQQQQLRWSPAQAHCDSAFPSNQRVSMSPHFPRAWDDDADVAEADASGNLGQSQSRVRSSHGKPQRQAVAAHVPTAVAARLFDDRSVVASVPSPPHCRRSASEASRLERYARLCQYARMRLKELEAEEAHFT